MSKNLSKNRQTSRNQHQVIQSNIKVTNSLDAGDDAHQSQEAPLVRQADGELKNGRICIFTTQTAFT